MDPPRVVATSIAILLAPASIIVILIVLVRP
jgi:hypothetical protein